MQHELSPYIHTPVFVDVRSSSHDKGTRVAIDGLANWVHSVGSTSNHPRDPIANQGAICVRGVSEFSPGLEAGCYTAREAMNLTLAHIDISRGPMTRKVKQKQKKKQDAENKQMQ